MQIDVAVFLIDDRVDRDLGLAGLAVADDQFALTAADRDHAVDCLDARLQRDGYALALDDPGRLRLDREDLRRMDRTFAVDRLAERVDDAPQKRFTDGNGQNFARAIDLRALADIVGVGQNRRGNRLRFKILRDAEAAVLKLQKFVCHTIAKPVDPRDAIADKDDGAGLRHLCAGVIGANLLFDDAADFFWIRAHLTIASFTSFNCRRMLASMQRSSICTTKPPMSASSSAYCASTLRPLIVSSFSKSAVFCASESGAALVTRAVTCDV